MNTVNSFLSNNNNFSIKKTATSTGRDSLNKLMKLGETMIIEKKFDIRRYLDSAENQFRLKNFKNNKISQINYSTDYLNYKKGNKAILSTYTNNNFFINDSISNSKIRADSFNNTRIKNNNNNNLKKTNIYTKIPNIHLTPISNRTKNNINFIQNKFKLKNDNISKYNFNTLKNKVNKNKIVNKYSNMFDKNKNEIKLNNEIEIIDNTNNNIDVYNTNNTQYNYNMNLDIDDDEEDKKIFKVEKAVRAIKRNKYTNYNIYKYLDKIKNESDKKQLMIGIDSEQLLNNFKLKQNKKLRERGTNLATFITQNKEISLNNLLIKLINKESDKLAQKEKERKEDLKNNKINLEKDEKSFEEYSDKQKIECKKIDKVLDQIQKRNKDLIGEEKKCKLEGKMKEFEIYKTLSKINLFCFYARFTNTILDGNKERFEKPILSDLDILDKIDFDSVVKEVINNFSDIKKVDLKKDKKNKKDKKKLEFIKEEGYFLNDPELMDHKFDEIENNIIRELQEKEKLVLNLKKIQIKNNMTLNALIERRDDLQKEYDEIYEKYKEEKEKFIDYVNNYGITHIDVNIHEKNNLIKDLYMSVINEFEPTITKMSKKNHMEFILIDKKELRHYDDIVNYGRKIIENIETNLNRLLLQIDNDEKSDKNLFDKVIYGIQNDYKLIRQTIFFNGKKEKIKKLTEKALEDAKKIVMVSKKSEPPYYKIKKPKKEKIDWNLIKREEERELMTYK